MSKEVLSDKQLIEKFLSGSVESFEELISRYETKAFNLAMRLMKNQEDAEEVLQDVFVTLYRKLSSFKGDSAFSSWLYRITVNASFMKLRKGKNKKAISLDEQQLSYAYALQGELGVKTDERVTCNEIKKALEFAIDKLPEDYRAVFILREIDGLSNKEVGEILSLSIPAVKSRLHRSRLMLRRRLECVYDAAREEHTPIITAALRMHPSTAL